MPKQKKVEAKSEPKKPIRTLAMGKKSTRAKIKVVAIDKTETKVRTAKPVVLKLPRTLKKAARACAKDQGFKLRAWIVELIKNQLGKESASSPA